MAKLIEMLFGMFSHGPNEACIRWGPTSAHVKQHFLGSCSDLPTVSIYFQCYSPVDRSDAASFYQSTVATCLQCD